MSFFKSLANLFTPRQATDRWFTIYALSHRGRVPITGRVDLYNELSLSDEGEAGHYHVRKVLHTSGEKRNFAEVEVYIWFDKNKQLIDHEVQGGRWLDEDEYWAELERFNMPDEEELDADSVTDTDEIVDS